MKKTVEHREPTSIPSLFNCGDINRQRTRGILAFFDFLRSRTKVLGLFVTGLYLELCELSRFLIGEERNQSFKFGCRLVRLISPSEHQMFKFPDCLIVIHISLFHEKAARNYDPTLGKRPTRQVLCNVTLPTESAAMERLHPRSSGESIGRWYWRYLGPVE